MPHDRLAKILAADVRERAKAGPLKGSENVIAGTIPPSGDSGPRVLLEDEGDKPFIRMNSNGYLGLSFNAQVVGASEAAVALFGTGPGAVRFISGTWVAHVALEERLGEFHDREAAMIFSSAYATVMGILQPLIDEHTSVISDELNHNSIINAVRLAKSAERRIYGHLDMAALEQGLQETAKTSRRAVIVTDGIFSMRGDHAPLDEIVALAEKYDGDFAENVLVVVDDSHGVGAFGDTGRGTEEYCNVKADLLIGTLGKAFGVNGGYVAGAQAFIDYLRETSPFYIYSNPITPGEAAAAAQAINIVDSPSGHTLLAHLRAMTAKFEQGLVDLGFETISGDHPVVPLMVRDTDRTAALVAHLLDHGVLATGLNFPVVPKGDEEIRFQISADHTEADIDDVLDILSLFEN